jgi:hypothetical protein
MSSTTKVAAGSSRTGYEPRPKKTDQEFNSDEETLEEESKNSGEREDNYQAGSFNKFVGGGLYGDTSIPASFHPMPKLTGNSAHQFADWKAKALNYFTANGLTEVVTSKPSKSITYAIKLDGRMRPSTLIKALWIRLNSKAYGVIRSAVESVLGTAYFEKLQK